MRVLIAPVGMQDPHGKQDAASGQVTEGSILQIARHLRPDRVILLPTKGPNGTERNAEDTREWLTAEGVCSNVVVRPIPMSQPNDYEDAIGAFGTVLRELCGEGDDECFVNTSSGTPAIKSACMMAIAEGVVRAEAWYADDPTKTARSDPVRRLDVGFLRQSALRQRIVGLLERGHFWAALEACRELETAMVAGSGPKAVSGWCVFLAGLQAWDERQYDEARRQVIEARRNAALTAHGACAEVLRSCLSHLDARSRPDSRPGWMGWDLYHMAARLALQGRHAIALEWAWVAVEASAKGRLSVGRGDGANFVQRLERIEGPDVTEFFRRSFQGRRAGQAMERLWSCRCRCIHEGEMASRQHSEAMLDLARAWLRDVVGDNLAGSPIATQALAALAGAFRSSMRA